MRTVRVENLDDSKYESQITLEGGREGDLVGGSRPRLVLTHKENKKKYIFKSYLHKPEEVISECLASRIGAILGLNIQQVTIRRLSPELVDKLRERSNKFPPGWVPVGTLASNIFPKTQEIKYGASILGTPSDKLALTTIEGRIRSTYYAADDLLESFARMIVFDAIIGNMDRHHENWGVVDTKSFRVSLLASKSKQLQNKRHFTPLYDHGSSLLFELSEPQIANYLKNEVLFEKKYILSAKYTFILLPDEKTANVFSIIGYHIESDDVWGKRFTKAIREICRGCNYLEIAKNIIQMPSANSEIVYTPNRKELVYRSVILRITRLLDMIEGR